MDQELEQQQQQENAAFEAGFSAVAGTPEPAAAPAQVEQPAAEVKPEGEGEQPAPATKEEPEAAAAPAADEPRIAGFTETELRTLLHRVPELEGQLRRAHGKLGEFGSVIQELRKAAVPQAPTPERIKELEAAFPDAAAFIRERMSAPQPEVEDPAPQQPTQAQQPSAADVEAQLMDHFHEGWREKIQSQDFGLWLAAQPEDVRNTFNTTDKAKVLHGVISKFDAWSAAQQSRKAKSSDRLANALTPAGTAGKPKTAPTEEEAFMAGFNSVISGR